MRTAQRNRSQHSGSKHQKEVVLTIEEAMAIADCDPVMIEKVETLLVHSGYRKRKEASSDELRC